MNSTLSDNQLIDLFARGDNSNMRSDNLWTEDGLLMSEYGVLYKRQQDIASSLHYTMAHEANRERFYNASCNGRLKGIHGEDDGIRIYCINVNCGLRLDSIEAAGIDMSTFIYVGRHWLKNLDICPYCGTTGRYHNMVNDGRQCNLPASLLYDNGYYIVSNPIQQYSAFEIICRPNRYLVANNRQFRKILGEVTYDDIYSVCFPPSVLNADHDDRDWFFTSGYYFIESYKSTREIAGKICKQILLPCQREPDVTIMITEGKYDDDGRLYVRGQIWRTYADCGKGMDWSLGKERWWEVVTEMEGLGG